MTATIARRRSGGRRALGTPSAYLVMLSLWLGATLFFSLVVARAAFQVLPSRSLAGQLVGQTLPVLLLAGVVGGILALWAELGSAPATGRRLRLGCAAGLAILSEAANLVGQHVDRLLESAGNAFESLSPADATRVVFGLWHGAAVLLLGLAMVLAAVAIVSAARAMPGYRDGSQP